ncbi:hypothetical protein [Brevibacillus panacihumi]|uniref:Tail fiber protein n=1 Tax=Brevibacillus panacihumi TaxID=497735 RepID=A0A3M8C945_9BACL|nr:hypothetical protein [Brevibacillus panacihumi]RNB72188.1 hypothetical protein EDM58_22045 [Brevibacillus panacihumi]
MAQLPSTATLKQIIAALQELECINQKADLASVVGSPAEMTDDVATIIGALQAAKNTLAANLNAKGQTASGSDSVQSLADKVGEFNGKRWATGTQSNVPISSTSTISGLAFTPTTVIVRSDAYCWTLVTPIFAGLSTRADTTNSSFFSSNGMPVSGGSLSIIANGFTVKPVYNAGGSNGNIEWIAFE